MSGPKRRILCPQCNQSKGISAFKNGSKMCGVCTNRYRKGLIIVQAPHILDQVQRLPLYPLPQIADPNISSEVKIENPEELDLSHLELSRQKYEAHHHNHPDRFKEGDWVFIIEGNDEIHTAPSYQKAVEMAEPLRGDKKWFCTQHGDNLDDVIPIQVKKTGEAVALAVMTLQRRYDAQILNFSLPRASQQTISLIDTGAGFCVIPYSLAIKLKAETEDRKPLKDAVPTNKVKTASSIVEIIYLDLYVQIGTLKSIKCRIGTIKDNEYTALCGMSYLIHTKATWYGGERLEIDNYEAKDLRKELEVFYGPLPSESKETDHIDTLQVESEKEEMRKTIQRLEAESAEREKMIQEERAKFEEIKAEGLAYMEKQDAQIKDLTEDIKDYQAQVVYWETAATQLQKARKHKS
jgi:uncharacterized coiled-coil protein SlyX